MNDVPVMGLQQMAKRIEQVIDHKLVPTSQWVHSQFGNAQTAQLVTCIFFHYFA